MSIFRNVEQVITYSPTGKRQSAIGTGLTGADLTEAVPIQLADRKHFRIDKTTEEIYSCSGEDLIDLLLTGRIGQLPIAFDLTPRVATVFIAYALGVAAPPSGAGPYTHLISRNPGYQNPMFSLGFGYNGKDGSQRTVLLKDCVVSNFRISSSARQKVRFECLIHFNANVQVIADYVIPDCSPQSVIRFGDCDLAVNGTSLAAVLREFTMTYDNRTLVNDHPFTSAGVDITRLERHSIRQSQINYAALGDETSSLYTDADTYAKRSHVLTLGPAGNRIVLNVPEAIMDLDGDGIDYRGEASETNVVVIARPRLVAGNAASPLQFTATNAQSVAYLIAA